MELSEYNIPLPFEILRLDRDSVRLVLFAPNVRMTGHAHVQLGVGVVVALEVVRTSNEEFVRIYPEFGVGVVVA